MTTNAELEHLLHDRFGITTADFLAALKSLPISRPWASSLTEDHARLLDDAGFVEDHEALLVAGIETSGYGAHIVGTAFTTRETVAALGITASRVRQQRLARELWAIPDGHTWLFPAMQFETNADSTPSRQIPGLGEVLKALPADLHPVAVAGFLRTPQSDLFQRRPMTPLEWLRDGGDVTPLIAVAANTDWDIA